MLQIRIKNFDGSDPIILDKAENKVYTKSVSSPDEGVSFQIAKNDIKAYAINPDTGGYLRVWEVWDTTRNIRLNYGPIEEITESGTNWIVKGAGRSAFLKDFYSSEKTFYASIGAILENVRFENIATEPRTSTIVHDAIESTDNDTVFGNVTIDERFHGLSTRTKDNVIDDNEGFLRPGEVEPPNTYYTSISYWAGMSKQDTIIVDLGNEYDLSKISIKFPWWNGLKKKNTRTFAFTLDYAISTEVPIVTLQGRDIGPWHQLFTTESMGSNIRSIGNTFYLGTPDYGISVGQPLAGGFRYLLTGEGPVSIRYIRIKITDVHAWYDDIFDADETEDRWDYECKEGENDGVMENKKISDTELGPANDCFASVAEIGAYSAIFERDTIRPLALQRVDNNSLQLIYNHTPDASETITTTSGFRKFEPGSFFRKFTFQFAGATNSYSKFYDSDCANCYPDPWAFGILDQNNSLVFSSDETSGTHTRKIGAQTKHVLAKGSGDFVVTNVDAWQARTDPLSWGGGYSYTTITGDYVIAGFRGQSFTWYATVPENETAGAASIEIRKKLDDNTWSDWDMLQASFQLPSAINSVPIYTIPFESGILEEETSYQIRLTNLGGFISLDSIEGHWSASATSYNEDSPRWFFSKPNVTTQIYDKRFSGGSMLKWNQKSYAGFSFEGDRGIIYSAKGRHHGKLSIVMYAPITSTLPRATAINRNNQVLIPGGELDTGILTINLSTGKRGNEYAQAIVFDTDDYFPGGLPWDRYSIRVYLYYEEEYNTTIAETGSDAFLRRCKSCKADTSNAATINEYIYLDGISVNERVGLSVSFDNQTKLEQLQSIAEATQCEWDITDGGINFEPRLGIDTEVLLRETTNTLVDWEIVNDATKIATMLISSGADIDGLPLFAVTEDKKTRAAIGRTIQRQQDYRGVADYLTLIGLSRGELARRMRPEKRITVTHTANHFNLNIGDTFLLHTKKMGVVRVRIIRKAISESSSGLVFQLECVQWNPYNEITVIEGTVPSFVAPAEQPPQYPGDEVDPEPIPSPPPSGPSDDFVYPPADGSSWDLVFEEDFDTDAAETGFLAAYSGIFSAYPTTYQDTSGNGWYDPNIISVHDSMADIYIRTTGGIHRIAAITPIISGSENRLYGRYEAKMRVQPAQGYRATYSLWPSSEVFPRDGAIIFPDGDFGQNISGIMHRQNGTSVGDADIYNKVGSSFDNWHIYAIEWTPTRCEFFIDGVSIGRSTSRIPNTPMHWTLKNETTSSTPEDDAEAHVYIDYIRIYEGNFTTIQEALNAASPGSTINVPAGIYRETVTINKAITLVADGPVILDGQNVRQYAFDIQSNNVTIDGFEIKNHRPPYQLGAVRSWLVSNTTLRNLYVHDNPGAGQYAADIGGGISFSGGGSHLVEDCIIERNDITGISANGYGVGTTSGINGLTVRRTTFSYNNPSRQYLGWHSGGIKVTKVNNFLIEDCISEYNNGDGIWADIDVTNSTIRDNVVHHNTYAGIHYEISDSGTIENNYVWECGWGRTDGWAFGAGIQISSSRTTTVENNIVAWCNRAISIIAQDRGSFPASSPGNYNNIVIDSNLVVSSNGKWMSSWVDDRGGQPLFSASGNAGTNGEYWAGVSEPTSDRFNWAGSKNTLAAYNATPGEQSGVYVSTPARDSALNAAGIPLTPESH